MVCTARSMHCCLSHLASPRLPAQAQSGQTWNVPSFCFFFACRTQFFCCLIVWTKKASWSYYVCFFVQTHKGFQDTPLNFVLSLTCALQKLCLKTNLLQLFHRIFVEVVHLICFDITELVSWSVFLVHWIIHLAPVRKVSQHAGPTVGLLILQEPITNILNYITHEQKKHR
jgi:hypothetical protein